MLYGILLLTFFMEYKNEKNPLSESNSAPRLISSSHITDIPAKNLKLISQNMGLSLDLSTQINYGISIYKIIYSTKYKNQQIKASGLAYIPIGMKEASAIVSLQHGTAIKKSDAPSIAQSFTGAELIASAGYCCFMPDYIGYGASADIFHPYYDQKHSALTVIDMIKSGKEFLKEKKIAFTDKLFLAGYSEGGYITLAAQKEIENDPMHALKLTAVAAGAGGYDLIDMLGSLNTDKTYPYPTYLAFIIESFNLTYDWNKSFDYFFAPEYAKKLPALVDGTHEGSYINAALTTNLDLLFNPIFFNNLKGSGEAEFKRALINNNLSNWKPVTPLHMYHGSSDEIIPYRNSQLTYDSFKDKGATDVQLISIAGGTHTNSFPGMLQSFIPWFNSLK